MPKIKKIHLIIFTLVCFLKIVCFSQELVNDGGFESIQLSWKDRHEVFTYEHWPAVGDRVQYAKVGAPKYSSYLKRWTTKRHFIDNSFKPAFGESYLMSTLNYLPLVLQNELLDTIRSGQQYIVSFWYKIFSDRIDEARVKEVMQSSIGCLFLTQDVHGLNEGYHTLLKSGKIKPQFSINNYHKDQKGDWVFFRDTFLADRMYTHVLLGNFKKLINKEDIGWRISRGIAYGIDEFSVLPIASVQTHYDNLTNPNDTTGNVQEQNGRTITSFLDSLLNQQEIPKNINQYYSQIHLAEKEIIQKNYHKSLAHYVAAFNDKVPFTRDYLNAWKLVVNHGVHDSSSLYRLAKATNGFSYKANGQKSKFERLQLTHESYRTKPIESIKSSPVLAQVSSQRKTDSMSIRLIQRLYERDQFKNRRHARVAAGDSINYIQLMSLYRRAELSEMTVGQPQMEKLKLMWLHISRYHYSGWIPLLLEETLAGRFDNRVFMALVDSYFIHNSTIGGNKQPPYFMSDIAHPLYSSYLIPDYGADHLHSANNRRNLIGLESVEDQHMKQLFNYRNGFEEFEFYQFFEMFPQFQDIIQKEQDAIDIAYQKMLLKYFENVFRYSKSDTDYQIILD